MRERKQESTLFRHCEESTDDEAIWEAGCFGDNHCREHMPPCPDYRTALAMTMPHL